MFADPNECDRFYRRSRMEEVKSRFEWADPISNDGPKILRVYKDAILRLG